MSLSFVAFASCSEDKEKTSSNGGSSVYKSGTQDGHDYVDLGLPSGTKWATCNVGATKPEEFGNFYAWGETTTKSTYSWGTYKYGNARNELTKYCNSSSHGKDGFADNKTTLDLSDDAAYVNWGGAWRMPTNTQQDELRSQCYWVWTESYNNSNVKGYIVYKTKNSNDKGVKVYANGTQSSSYTLSDAHIFLPAAGGSGSDAFFMGFPGSSGYYWSSSPSVDDLFCGYAWIVLFDLDHVNDNYQKYGERFVGLSVRAVIPGN